MVVLVLVGSGDGSMDCLTFFLPCHHSHTREYALVSLVDPNCKDEWAQRVDKLEELPKLLAALFREPAYIEEEEERGEAGEERWEYDAEGIARPVAAVPRRAPAASNGGELEWVYVRVLRPAGPTYTVLELPGLPAPPGAEGEDPELDAGVREVLRQHPAYLLLALVPVPDLFHRARSVWFAKEVREGRVRLFCRVRSALVGWGGGWVCVHASNARRPGSCPACPEAHPDSPPPRGRSMYAGLISNRTKTPTTTNTNPTQKCLSNKHAPPPPPPPPPPPIQIQQQNTRHFEQTPTMTTTMTTTTTDTNPITKRPAFRTKKHPPPQIPPPKPNQKRPPRWTPSRSARSGW